MTQGFRKAVAKTVRGWLARYLRYYQARGR